MSYDSKATKTEDNVESHAGMKKEPLVRWMAKPNVVTKESPDTQQTSYGLRAVTTGGEAESRARQAPLRNKRAIVQGLQRQTVIPRVRTGEAKP